MKKYALIVGIFFTSGTMVAQNAAALRETAQSFFQQADYANAVLVLNRALQHEPGNIDLIKDLSLAYYFQKDNTKALETIKPLLDGDNADDQSYQIAGNIYLQLSMPKEAEKLYRKGIKKFPESGAMYNELGEILMAQQDYSAIKLWKKGIEVDPGFSRNYYNASKYYYLTANKVWSTLYGEIFVNMEPLGNRTPEIKGIILEGYKKLFSEADLTKNVGEAGQFELTFLQLMNKQTSLASLGINPESLTMIRTRFILEWFNSGVERPAFKLFELQRQLLQEGMFNAYNQWIFGTAQNLASYQNWVTNHSAEYNEFNRFQRSRVFKIPAGQYIP